MAWIESHRKAIRNAFESLQPSVEHGCADAGCDDPIETLEAMFATIAFSRWTNGEFPEAAVADSSDEVTVSTGLFWAGSVVATGVEEMFSSFWGAEDRH